MPPLPLLALPVGTAPDAAKNASLSPLGPQSARPLPRWYWRNPADPKKNFLTPSRWRKFDDAAANLLHEFSEKKGPLKTGFNKPLGMTILTWDHDNRRGTFHWKDKKVRQFERLSQAEAAAVQVNNFVYDNTQQYAAAQYLSEYPHAVEAFREMMRFETQLAKTHVFFYHSYGGTALINDLGACVARLAFPAKATDEATRNAILPRTDRSAFNNRSPSKIVRNFQFWYGVDTTREFMEIGMSTVLNCIKPDTEATVSEYFKGNYSVGTNLSRPFDDILTRFGLEALRDDLLQLALEADFDVGPYFDDVRFFARRGSSERWRPIDDMNELYDLNAAFKQTDFYDDDNELGPANVVLASGRAATLFRAKAGAQARGTLQLSNGTTVELLLNTVNTGNYLQLAIPHELVEKLAYANVLYPTYGTPDPDEKRALGAIKTRKITVDGQARLIPRPDLMWAPGVQQRLFHFSRHAAESREAYLRAMEKLILTHFARVKVATGVDPLQRARRVLDPQPIVVRSHNCMWEAQDGSGPKQGVASNTPLLAQEHGKAKFSFLCLQECVGATVEALRKELSSNHALLTATSCGAKRARSVLAYDSERFVLVREPFYTCFQLDNGTFDSGRPICMALFDDAHLFEIVDGERRSRRVAVASVHAPHLKEKPYSLIKNLNRCLEGALERADGTVESRSTLAHVIFAGDFNRQDWDKPREIWGKSVSQQELVSAQNPKQLAPTLGTRAYDNVLFSSRDFLHTLEKLNFNVTNSLGSDHRVVQATFAA